MTAIVTNIIVEGNRSNVVESVDLTQMVPIPNVTAINGSTSIATGYKGTREPREISVKRNATGEYVQYILGMTYNFSRSGAGTEWMLSFTNFTGTESNVTIYYR